MVIYPDPLPLGVSGTVTIPLPLYVARTGRRPDAGSVIIEEGQRVAYVARRLSEVLDQPLTSQGSAGLARSVLAYFQNVELMAPFAEKAIETLRDGKPHNRTAISSRDPHVAVLFVAWCGTHYEVMSQRLGNYFGPLVATARRIIQSGIQLAGFLEIDAYLRDNPDLSIPGKALDEVFEVDVEYSYLPGFALGCASATETMLPKVILLNLNLCTLEEQEFISKLVAQCG